MNNKKRKLLSLFAAVSITATAFTGLAIPASAASGSAAIDFTNTTLTADVKGNSTVFEAGDAATVGATALAAAGAGNVLKVGSSQSNPAKYLGYTSILTPSGTAATEYAGVTTLSFKLEPMQIRTDRAASAVLQFADINKNAILPISVCTGSNTALTVNGASVNVAYGNYYNVTENLDFNNGKASITIKSADNATTLYEASDITITAKNLAYMYYPDTAWNYGYFAIDDISIESTNAGVSTYYTATINTERYAKLTTSDNKVYYADVNGKLTIDLIEPNTTIDYTLTKEGYNDVTGTLTVTNSDVTDSKPMTKKDSTVIYVESEFGNKNDAFVAGSGSRIDTISLGEIDLSKVIQFTADFNFAGFGSYEGESQRSWAIVTDAGKLAGIQLSADGLSAWADWKGSDSMDQSKDKFATTAPGSSVVLSSTLPSDDFSVDFVIDPTAKAITVLYGENSYSLSFSTSPTKITGLAAGLYRYNGELKTTKVTVVEPNANFMAVAGASKVAKVSGQTITRQYKKSETVISDSETFTWSVSRSDEKDMTGITIDNTGLLSIKDTAEPGTVTITCASDTNTQKTAGFNVTVADFQQLTLTAEGPKAYEVAKAGEKSTYKITSATDTYGDDVTSLIGSLTKWTSSNTAAATIDESTGELTTVAAGTTTVTATVTNGTAVSTITIPVTVAKYSITQNVTAASTEIDLSTLVTDDAITGYLVTTAKDNETVDSYEVAKADVKDNKITVDTSVGGKYVANEAAIKITATYKDDILTGITKTDVAKDAEVDLTAADGTKVFLWNSLDGMKPVSTTYVAGSTNVDSVEVAPIFTATGTDVASADDRCEFIVPADSYNVTATMSGQRADVYVNDQLVKNNMLQYGSAEATRTEHDIVINEGYAVIKTCDYSSGKSAANTEMTLASIVKSPSIVTRTPKMYVLGDSLVAEYYNDADTMTGWGQVLQNYIDPSIEVVDIANSGADSLGIKATQMTRVLTSGKSGDYMILESGYNDKGHNIGTDVMKETVNAMAADAKAKGINVVFVSPNASAHDYNNSVAWTSSMKSAAEASSTNFINLSELSYNYLYSKYGTAYTGDNSTVKAIYNIYRSGENGLHSTVNGANCWAAIMATEIAKLYPTTVKVTDYTYTFNDGTNDIVVQAGDKMTPVYTITTAENTPSVTYADASGNTITSAAAGTVVTIVPGTGVSISGVTVAGTTTTSVNVTETNGTYTFTMPAEAVTVTITGSAAA